MASGHNGMKLLTPYVLLSLLPRKKNERPGGKPGFYGRLAESISHARTLKKIKKDALESEKSGQVEHAAAVWYKLACLKYSAGKPNDYETARSESLYSRVQLGDSHVRESARMMVRASKHFFEARKYSDAQGAAEAAADIYARVGMLDESYGACVEMAEKLLSAGSILGALSLFALAREKYSQKNPLKLDFCTDQIERCSNLQRAAALPPFSSMPPI